MYLLHFFQCALVTIWEDRRRLLQPEVIDTPEDRRLFGFLTPPPDKEEETASTPPALDHDKVQAWRIHQLQRAGYDFDIAEQLALARVDYRKAERLLQASCAQSLAKEILT